EGVRALHWSPRGQAGRDDVLGDVARHVAGGAVDLRRILAREGAAAVRARAAVRIDDDLPSGEAGVAHRPARHEAPGRIYMDHAALEVDELRRDRRGDHLLDDVVADALGTGVGAVLGGDHD